MHLFLAPHVPYFPTLDAVTLPEPHDSLFTVFNVILYWNSYVYMQNIYQVKKVYVHACAHLLAAMLLIKFSHVVQVSEPRAGVVRMCRSLAAPLVRSHGKLQTYY